METTIPTRTRSAEFEEIWAILKDNALQQKEILEKQKEWQKEADERQKEADERQKEADERREKEAAERRKEADERLEKESAERKKEIDRINKEADERRKEADERLEKESAERRKEGDERRKEIEQMNREAAERRREADERREREAAEWRKELEQMDKEYRKRQKRLDKQMGDLTNRFGELAEHLVAPNINKRFNELGYHFGKVAPGGLKIEGEDGKTKAEIDLCLENGKTVMAVEVKAKPKLKHIEEHIKRLEILRDHQHKINDYRQVEGAIAGAIFGIEEKKATIEAGLYVIEQTGDTMRIEVPDGFVPRKW